MSSAVAVISKDEIALSGNYFADLNTAREAGLVEGSNPSKKALEAIVNRHNSAIASGQESQSLEAHVESNQQARGNTEKLDKELYNGVGTFVQPEWGTDKILSEAGLDWEVVERDVIYDDGNGGKIRTDDYKVLCRENDPSFVFDVVRKGWHPYQNAHIVGSFVEFCRDTDLELERVGALDSDRLVFAVARMNDSFELPDEDIVDGRIILTNSHSKGRGQRISLMTRRLVCTNGMTVPVTIGRKVITHLKEFDRKATLNALNAARSNFRTIETESRALAQRALTKEEAHVALINILGDINKSVDEQPKAVQECLELYHGKGIGSDRLSAYNTAWGVVNSVTEYQNHRVMKPFGAQAHMNSLWFGGKAQKQLNAYRQMVGVSVAA
ncbi:MAG: DUF932 domain-containing protein [Cyanobacteria bacterium J06639_14]